MPDIFYDSLDQVPEGLRESAKQGENGKLVVKVVPQSKLDEFRDNNIKISKERDDAVAFATKAKEIIGDDFEGFTATLGELKTTAQRVKDGELVANKSIEEALAERTKQMRDDMTAENQRLAGEVKLWKDKQNQTDSQLRRTYVDRALTDVVLDEGNGVNPKALTDILNRAYGVFNVGDDGTLTPKKGDAVIYGGDGATPMSPKEWVQSLKEDAPYYFKGSHGGGADGGDAKTLHGMTNADIAKLPPEQRLAIANGEFGKR